MLNESAFSLKPQQLADSHVKYSQNGLTDISDLTLDQNALNDVIWEDFKSPFTK